MKSSSLLLGLLIFLNTSSLCNASYATDTGGYDTPSTNKPKLSSFNENVLLSRASKIPTTDFYLYDDNKVKWYIPLEDARNIVVRHSPPVKVYTKSKTTGKEKILSPSSTELGIMKPK